jgi:hypothetical protein
MKLIGVLLGVLLAAIPFAFGSLRAFSTGTDFRYLWVALAAAVAAAAVLRWVASDARHGAAVFGIALIASALAASVAGFALGARSAPAILVVAFGFAMCEAGGFTIAIRARAT